LAPGDHVTAGSSPLGQVFGDAALTQNHPATFVERTRMPVMGFRLSETSARNRVAHSYREISQGKGHG